MWAEKEVTEEETVTPSEAPAEEIEKEETTEVAGKKKVYLTFDDGPSTYTGEILDILKEYNVKATFFVVGREDEKYRDLYKRIVDEGHSLGIHSYSHRYWEIYESVDTFAEDITKLQDTLFEITGVRPQITRFPGGSSNRVSKADMKDIISYVNEKEIVYYDWNISSGDAVTNKLTADRIIENCMNGITEFESSIILMHDASDKHTTVEALPVLIEKILESDDTVLLPITEETQPIQHIK